MAKLTPIKAIRAKCMDCSCGSMVEVRECPVKTCPLHEYRHGKRPETIERRANRLEQKKVELRA